MFKFLADSAKNALDVVTGTYNGLLGEDSFPTTQQVGKLIADGVTVAVVADLYGVSVEAIESLLEDTK